MTMTPEEVIELNKGRYTFRDEPTSTKYSGYKKFPGHVLVEDFLVPYYPAELTDLARRTGIPLKKLHKFIRGEARVDLQLANQLGNFYGTGSQFWLDLQEKFERGIAI